MRAVTWETRLRGATSGFLLTFSPFYGAIFMAFWLLPILFVNHKLYRRSVDFMVGMWFWYPAAILEFFLGIKVKITGDKIQAGENNLLLLNHRTRLDWMFFWSVLARQSGITNEKIILKAPLKLIPGAGWAMQAACFLFLVRRWEEDQSYMNELLEYFANIQYKIQLMVFPEGTNMEVATKAASDRFAAKNGLKAFDYVLHPRTTGFTHIMQKMRERKSLDAVYDIHVGYPKGTPETEMQLCAGRYTEEVHFHITRYEEKQLPEEKEELEEWLRQHWIEKEEALKEFYMRGYFEDNAKTAEEMEAEESNEVRTKIRLAIAGIYWTSLVLGSFVFIYKYTLVQVYCLTCMAFFTYTTYYGGYELLQAKYVNSLYNSSGSSSGKELLGNNVAAMKRE